MDAALIISIVSISLTSLIGFWNIRINLQNHRLKQLEVKWEAEKKVKEEFDARPKLEILETSPLLKYDKNDSKVYDIDCLVAPIENYHKEKGRHEFDYNEELLNTEQWVSLIYKLKNVGRSTIDHLYLSWNSQRNTSLFDVKDSSYLFEMSSKLLNYRVFCEKEVKNNEELVLRINFHKDKISYGLISSEASIWMFDEYNVIWEQPFFVHKKQIYDSHRSSFNEFKNLTDIKDALICFESPYLW